MADKCEMTIDEINEMLLHEINEATERKIAEDKRNAWKYNIFSDFYNLHHPIVQSARQ